MRKSKIFKILLMLISYTLAQPIYSDELHSNCYGYLTELVRTSNFPFREVDSSKINLIIDRDQDDEIFAQLVYDQPPALETNTFTAIGWIKYKINDQQLFNTSADLDNPEKLVFNNQYAIKFKKMS